MKLTNNIHHSAGLLAAARFELFIQDRNGRFHSCLRADNAEDAVAAFLWQSPLFDGGDIRLIDHLEQRMVAFVEWHPGRTELGITVLERRNTFHDWNLALLAYECLQRGETQDSVNLSA
jgi:hypothetical protein